MKTAILSISLLAVAPTVLAQVSTSEFTGFYGGVQIGTNHSTSTEKGGVSKRTSYPGLLVGYSSEMKGVLVGVEAFADYHNDSTTYKDGGFGIKVGKVVSDVLVYGRLGQTGTWPSWRTQVGIGAETKLNKNLSLNVIYSNDKSTHKEIRRENESLAVGVNYYYR
jgi:outer membrane immunogenic protein